MDARSKIELLSPARNAEVGKEAIWHGADAVYIGGPMFGARAAAGNSLADIESLCKVAHTYYSKVYVTLNTILTDAELAEAEVLVKQLYEAGVDGLIVQDYGITQLSLPPIALHASTQMDTRTPEKAKFLQDAGFQQVVLARELSVNEIKAVADATTVRLEAFIHGALCVSYSGQCYLSCAMTGRSANRGTCAQLCRLPYRLTDAEGHTLVNGKHLLSLRDMNLSSSIMELLDAGVSSLKIEGRLKDAAYVKNVTAYYRKTLDAILGSDKAYQPSSSGSCIYTFEPCLEKSFNRGFTEYFFHGRKADVASLDTPKSQGEPLGRVKLVGKNFIDVETKLSMNNGDGLCFINANGQFEGFKANRVEGTRVFPLTMPKLKAGVMLMRNCDAAFEKLLAKPSAERKISVMVAVEKRNDGFLLKATDENNVEVCLQVPYEFQEAKNAEMAMNTIRQQLSKTGNTPFAVKNVELGNFEPCFIPSSVLADWRRQLVELLENEREKLRKLDDTVFPATSHSYLTQKLDYRANVYNKNAEHFLKQHGVATIEPAYELGKERNEVELMLCRHCIRYTLGACSKTASAKQLPPNLFLVDPNGNKTRLVFDCKNCQMKVMGRLANK
ncbi:MAG: U32 family peptidase [Paludibacteraceae bacterium]|nr:U32 family peptidase [Paludibacteraceae bacterium]